MPPESFTKAYRPGQFVSSTSFTGAEAPLILHGENMWIRFGRYGSVYAESYTGSKDLSETIPTLTVTGTITWSTATKNVVGQAGVAQFRTQLIPGMQVWGDGGAN